MSIETLVVTVDDSDYSLPEKMNIRTDAIIGNQCGKNGGETFLLNGHRISYVNSTERGVGRNRNTVIKNASADICVFADDDMRFVDDYPEIAQRAFDECPAADVLIFNLIEKHPRRYVNRKIRRIGRSNYGRYGAARLAVRRKSIVDAGIVFSTEFGGGAKYSAGEDTIFLKECLDKGLLLYAVPYALAEIDQTAESTWFKGFNDKFFADKGALYARLYPRTWRLQGLRFLLLRRKKYRGEMSSLSALKSLIKGGKSYRSESESSR